MPPPQFSRRRRRWVHTVKAPEMRCFTDEELRRGCQRIVDLASDHVGSSEDWLAIFLQAAQPTAGQTDDDWPAKHPMHCWGCGRAITDPSGKALVEIHILERQWTCAACAAPTIQ